jgi:phage terminase small subunit
MSKKNEYKINFLIINNKNKEWKKNETYLKSNIDSQIKIEDFKLNPLNKDHYQKVILSLPELNEFDEGDVNLILDFCVSNKIYGPPLKIILRIILDPKNEKLLNF